MNNCDFIKQIRLLIRFFNKKTELLSQREFDFMRI